MADYETRGCCICGKVVAKVYDEGPGENKGFRKVRIEHTGDSSLPLEGYYKCKEHANATPKQCLEAVKSRRKGTGKIRGNG